MKEEKHIVIAGAGCSGLALADEFLREHPAGLSITLIDPDLHRPISKSWSFWGSPPPLAKDLVRHSWHSMHVVFPSWRGHQRLRGNTYHCVDGETYRRTLLERLRKDRRVTLLEDRVDETHDLGGTEGVFVQAGQRTIHGRWLFQSFRQPSVPRGSLMQHFVGWEVECDEDNFDPSAFTLMDFCIPQDGTICFFYVLPFGTRRALVECTSLTTDSARLRNHDLAVFGYLKERIRGGFRRVRRERGVIPMSAVQMPQQTSTNVFNIGAAGGMTKASTGYTFRRSLRQANHLAVTARRTGQPEPLPSMGTRFRKYDAMFLKALAAAPEQGRELFRELFANNSFDDVLSFLAEQTSMAKELRMLSRLPWRPILAPHSPAAKRPTLVQAARLQSALETP